MSSLRVLHVGKFYPPARGGMEKVLQVLAEGERAGGIDSRVLVANEGTDTVTESVNGVPVTRVGTLRRVGAVALCPGFPFWLRRADADVMVVHEPNPVAIVAHLLAQPRVPFIFFVHAEVVRPAWRYKLFYRPFLRRMLKRAARIVVTSPRMIDIAEELQAYREKCVAVPLALDAATHALTPDLAVRVEQLKTERPEPLVLFVGRLVPYKGVEYLLRALPDVGARAVIVGDGPLRLSLEALARELNVADRVRFTGDASSSDLTALYHACDLFVLPSITKAEAFGMVQLEAMSCGKPVICTDLPSGVPWVNQHGVTGLVVPPRDPAALATAMAALIADPTLRQTMGNNGRRRVQTEFTPARMLDQTTALYRSLAPAPIGRGSAVSL